MGGVLIAIGIVLQLQQTGILRVEFWQLWPVAIIIAGIGMLWQAFTQDKFPAITNPHFDSVYIFGAGERQVNTQQFKGGSLFEPSGRYKIALSHADLDHEQVVLE